MKQIGEYVLDKKIGAGAFAQVFRGYSLINSSIYAIKVVDVCRLADKNSKLTENLNYEIKILKELYHPNIVRLYDVLDEPPPETNVYIYMIMECCEGGDFSKYIRTHKKLTEEKALYFMKQLASGLKFLRERDIVHRDLKPQNLLLSDESDNPILKIGDFGFAKFIGQQQLSDTFCGSPLYMAPEILYRKNYTVKADLWSVGVILYEMLVGEPAYNCGSVVDLIDQLKNKKVKMPPHASPQCQDLIFNLLQIDVNQRISWDNFFNHPWLNLNNNNQNNNNQNNNNISYPISINNNNYNNYNNNNTSSPPNYYNDNYNNNNYNNNNNNNNNYNNNPNSLPFSNNNNNIYSSPTSNETTMPILNKSKSFENTNAIKAYPFKDDKKTNNLGQNNSNNSNNNKTNSGNNSNSGSGSGSSNNSGGGNNLSSDFEKDLVILADEENNGSGNSGGSGESIERIYNRAIAIAELGDLRQYEPLECLPLYLLALNLLKPRILKDPSNVPEKYKTTFKDYTKKCVHIFSTSSPSAKHTLDHHQHHLNHHLNTFSPNRYIYENALEFGKKGAVEELYSNFSTSLHFYSSATLLLEYLFSISTDKSDHEILKKYIKAFNERVLICKKNVNNNTQQQ